MPWASGDTVTSSTLRFRDNTGPVFNVRDPSYGATGNGSTDDANAIQSALGAADAAGGGVVYVPDGVYIIGSALTIGSNTQLLGSGFSAVLKAEAALNDAMLTNEDLINGNSRIIIVDLRIDGNIANQTSVTTDQEAQAAIRTRKLQDSVIERIEISDWNGHGISLLSPIRVKILHNTLSAISGNGISINNLSADSSFDCHIVGNSISSNLGTGNNDGVIVDGSGLSSYNHVVTNNVIVACVDGIDVQEGVIHTTISGNVCQRNSSDGISLSAGQTPTAVSRLVVVGNVLADNSGQGILIDDSVDIVCNDNVSFNNGTGILITDSVGGTANGNYVYENDGDGLRFQRSQNWTASSNVAKNNSQSAGDSGIRVDGSATTNGINIVLIGNRCFDDQGGQTQDYGIRVLTSTDSCVIVGNIVSDNIQSGISATGDNNVIANNIGSVTTT